MIRQLRICEIFENNKAGFHDRFRDHAARIMQRYGFQILAMWETKFGDRTGAGALKPISAASHPSSCAGCHI